MFDHQKRRFDMILVALAGAPRDQHDIAKTIHMSLRWTRDYLNRMCEAELIHIVEWVRIGEYHRYPNALYQRGAGTNMPHPGPQTAHDRWRAAKRALHPDTHTPAPKRAKDHARQPRYPMGRPPSLPQTVGAQA